MNPDPHEQDMLSKLAAIGRGFNPMTGQHVSQSEMLAAQRQYTEMKSAIEQRGFAREKLSADLSVEDGRIRAQKELEHRRLDIEEDKVRVQKAEVIVKALEVAVKGGADPQALLVAIQGLSSTLLPSADSLLQIDKKNG